MKPSHPCAPNLTCRSCGKPFALGPADHIAGGSAVIRCIVCGDDKFYVQKAFSQKAGCLIVAAGAALVPWTYGLSLAVCAALDWILHRMLASVAVCYICRASYGGLPLNPDHKPYDLMTAQTWEARALTWRRTGGQPAD